MQYLVCHFVDHEYVNRIRSMCVAVTTDEASMYNNNNNNNKNMQTYNAHKVKHA